MRGMASAMGSNRVTSAALTTRIDLQRGAALLQCDKGVEHIAFEIVDHNFGDLGAQAPDDGIQQVMSKRTLVVGTLQLGRDGVRFSFADPDKQIALDLGILEDNDPAIVCKVDAHALDEASNEHGYLPFLTCGGPGGPAMTYCTITIRPSLMMRRTGCLSPRSRSRAVETSASTSRGGGLSTKVRASSKTMLSAVRSEERRVGKECRTRGGADR